MWRVSLSLEDEAHWRTVLLPDEVSRADCFHFAQDRRRFTVTRGILRALLGTYVGIAPESLTFTFNQFGRPSLSAWQNRFNTQFNVSHSGNFSLLAFSLRARLGVDIEQVSADRDIDKLAETLLSPTELRAFLDLPIVRRKLAFFRMWTLKEALTKALGNGLSIPFRNLEVGVFDDHALPVICAVPNLIDTSKWYLRSQDVGAEYVAALAVESGDPAVRLWSW